jgi:hypothetical protein
MSLPTANAVRDVVVEIMLKDPLEWLHVPCPDFDAFQALPLLIRFHERYYTRRGWNSDTGVGYYQPGAERVAFAVEPSKED